MFTVEERDRVRSRLLEIASADPRVVAGAEIGALVAGGDRWSDVDLTFGVDDGVPVDQVLADWTRAFEQELGAVHFDLGREEVIYRVFLLPGCLQVDVSFAPASRFGPRGPRFALLFGTAVELDQSSSESPRHLFGLAVHHALRARICVERGLFWRAEYWIAELRRRALEFACLRRGLESSRARGFDHLTPTCWRPRATHSYARSRGTSCCARWTPPWRRCRPNRPMPATSPRRPSRTSA